MANYERTRTVTTPRGTVIVYSSAAIRPHAARQEVTWTLEQKFLARVEKRDGHWLWISNLDKDGYGRFYVGKPEGKHKYVRAHRWSYEHWNRPLEAGEVPDHGDCPRNCVNPEHLEAMSHADNARKGHTDRMARRVRCRRNHLLADTAGKNGRCKACAAEDQKSYYARRAEAKER